MKITFGFLAGLVSALMLTMPSAVADELFLDPLFEVDVFPDITYGTGEVGYGTPEGISEIDLKLDLYAPTGDGLPSAVPGVVLVHGGGFTGGDKSALAGLATDFASRGYVAVSINYRLLGDNPPPAPTPPPPGISEELNNAVFAAIVDAAFAVGWMRGGAETLGVDPDRIGIGGSSAGAVTSLFVGMANIEGAEVATIIDLWGGMYGQEDLVESGDPPVFIVHGVNDTVVPFQLAEDLVAAATAVGLPFDFFPIEGAGHGVSLDTVVDGLTLREHLFAFQFEHLGLDEYGVDFAQTVAFGASGVAGGDPGSLQGIKAFEQVFNQGSREGDEYLNMGVGGANSFSISDQIDAYEALRNEGTVPPASLIMFQVGANDINKHFEVLSQFAPGENQQVDSGVKLIRRNIRDAIFRLNGLDPQARFAVSTLPDPTYFPLSFGQLTEEQETNLRANVEVINRFIRNLERFDRVVVVDLFQVAQDAAGTPIIVQGQEIAGPPAAGEPDNLFADDVHLTAVGNALLANWIIAVMNERFEDLIPMFTEEELGALAGF